MKKKGIIMVDQSMPAPITAVRPIDSLQICLTTGRLELPNYQRRIRSSEHGNFAPCMPVSGFQELTQELRRYGWDIIGLSEVRWFGTGETAAEEGHKIWFSGKEKIHLYGVAFIVR